jgi:hypothetical protein
MPALVAIVSKVMLLTDYVLENFVNVWAVTDGCNLTQVYGTVLPCGNLLADAWANVVLAGSQFLGHMLAAIAVNTSPI